MRIAHMPQPLFRILDSSDSSNESSFLTFESSVNIESFVIDTSADIRSEYMSMQWCPVQSQAHNGLHTVSIFIS